MSSDSASSPEDVRTGASCPLEIFNEFQMDIQDPGPSSTPFLQAWSQARARGGWCCAGPWSPTAWEPAEKSQTVQTQRRINDGNSRGQRRLSFDIFLFTTQRSSDSAAHWHGFMVSGRCVRAARFDCRASNLMLTRLVSIGWTERRVLYKSESSPTLK